MRKKLKTFTRSLNKLHLFMSGFLALLGFQALGAKGVMPIDDTEITLPDGRIIKAVRCGVHCHCLEVTRAQKKLRRQCYQEEFDRLWDYTFFVPIKKGGSYAVDINGDGTLEIGIATWDGGNNIADRYAMVFSVRGNKLVYVTRKKFNLEYGEYLFE